MKVVVLGGYGNFGTRICRELAKDSAIELIVAGRNARRCEALAGTLRAAHAAVDTSAPRLGDTLLRLHGGPNHHGPEIPCMPAILLARRLARGAAWAPGAQACTGLLQLEEFTPMFEQWGMQTEWQEGRA